MTLVRSMDVAFAVAVVVAGASLAAAALRIASVRVLAAATALVFAGAVAAWVVYALHLPRERELAVAATGLVACALATAGSAMLRRAQRRADDVDARLEESRAKLNELVEAEAAERGAELERVLARARADSVSLLIEEERRIADERRREFAERERESTASLTEALTHTQAQVEQRLAAWAQDLDRAAEGTKLRIAELSTRQKQLLSEVEVRLAADADRLSAESEDQRAALIRMRGELDKALEDAMAAAQTEVESHGVERRRALNELEERMRRRERELAEHIEREEAEAVQRIRAGFEDASRRQVEHMERVVARATAAYGDEAAQQFATVAKAAREDAARRLARELERAVEVFAREAESVLAERLAQVGDAGAQRLERRMTEVTKGLERQRDEWTTALDRRVAELEADVRRRLDELNADAEAERGVLEARLQELMRRLDATSAVQSSS
jgi:hypothetical protein